MEKDKIVANIDCLLEVTARFFKAGEKTNENLEDTYSFTSYGQWDDNDGKDYWEYLPPYKEVEAKEDDNCLQCFQPEDLDHYVILKDFVGFGFRPVFFGDFADGRGSGVYFDDIGLDEYFVGCEDALVEYAEEERLIYNENRKRIRQKPFYISDIPEETHRIKFILALKYNVNCHPSGPWGPEEYDSDVEIAGKLDMSKIAEILK